MSIQGIRAICDVCDRVMLRSDLIHVRDPYSLQCGLAVCRRCIDKTNTQSYPFSVNERPVSSPETLRPPKSVVPISIGTSERAPTAPQNLVAFASGTTIMLSWDGPEQQGTSPIIGYQIERNMVAPDPWLVLSTEAIMGYNDIQAVITETYTYRVAAVNSYGISPYSNIAYFPTLAQTESRTVLSTSDTDDVLLTGDGEALLYLG